VSGAIVSAIAHGGIEWETDPDFGYEIATSVPGVGDTGLLRPRTLYAAQGRSAEHDAIVATLHADRHQHLASYPDLRPEIVDAV